MYTSPLGKLEQSTCPTTLGLVHGQSRLEKQEIWPICNKSSWQRNVNEMKK